MVKCNSEHLVGTVTAYLSAPLCFYLLTVYGILSNEDKEKTVRGIGLTMASISMPASLWTWWAIESDSNLRKLPLMHIASVSAVVDVSLSLKQFLESFYFFSSGEGFRGISCTLWACWGQFFAMATVVWSCVYAVHLALFFNYPLTIGRLRSLRAAAKLLWAYHIIGWGVPFLTCTLAFFVDGGVGNNDGMCWLKGDARLLFVVPLVFCVVLVQACIGLVIRRIQLNEKTISSLTRCNKMSTQRRHLLRRVLIVTECFVALWFFPALATVLSLLHHKVPAWISYMSALCVGAYGFVVACIWFPFLCAARRRVYHQPNQNFLNRLRESWRSTFSTAYRSPSIRSIQHLSSSSSIDIKDPGNFDLGSSSRSIYHDYEDSKEEHSAASASSIRSQLHEDTTTMNPLLRALSTLHHHWDIHHHNDLGELELAGTERMPSKRELFQQTSASSTISQGLTASSDDKDTGAVDDAGRRKIAPRVVLRTMAHV